MVCCWEQATVGADCCLEMVDGCFVSCRGSLNFRRNICLSTSIFSLSQFSPSEESEDRFDIKSSVDLSNIFRLEIMLFRSENKRHFSIEGEKHTLWANGSGFQAEIFSQSESKLMVPKIRILTVISVFEKMTGQHWTSLQQQMKNKNQNMILTLLFISLWVARFFITDLDISNFRYIFGYLETIGNVHISGNVLTADWTEISSL